MRRAGATALVAFACAAGCGPKGRYSPPPPTPVAAFKENANWKQAQPRDADVRGAWWDIFGDPALAALETKTDLSNQTLKVAEAQFAQARAAVRGARANLFPQVASAPGVSATRSSANRAFATFHDPYSDIVLPVDASYEADVCAFVPHLFDSLNRPRQVGETRLTPTRTSDRGERDRELAVRGSLYEVYAVLFVFVAHVLEDVGVGLEQVRHLDRKGLVVRLRVVDGDLDIQMPHVATPIFFGQAHCFAVRMPAAVEPRLIVETDALHDQRVAVPSADGKPEPRRIGIGRERPSVGINLSRHSAVELVHHDDQPGRLNDLVNLGQKRGPRHAGRQAPLSR